MESGASAVSDDDRVREAIDAARRAVADLHHLAIGRPVVSTREMERLATIYSEIDERIDQLAAVARGES